MVVGADSFSCAWTNRAVSLNYKLGIKRLRFSAARNAVGGQQKLVLPPVGQTCGSAYGVYSKTTPLLNSPPNSVVP